MITDWYMPCNQVTCVLAGNDLRMPYGEPELLKAALESGALHRGHLQQCATRLLRVILNMD